MAVTVLSDPEVPGQTLNDHIIFMQLLWHFPAIESHHNVLETRICSVACTPPLAAYLILHHNVLMHIVSVGYGLFW